MTTPRLTLPELIQNQTQPHVPVNASERRLDALVQPTALQFEDTPPVTPEDGDVYIIDEAPSGAWAGKADQIAYYSNGWQYVVPLPGFCMFVLGAWANFRYADGDPHDGWQIEESGGGGGSGGSGGGGEAQPSGVQTFTISASSHDDVPIDSNTGFLEVDTNAQDGVITGFSIDDVEDGREVVVSCTGSNTLTINALDSDSDADHQVRASADITILPNGSITIRASFAIGKWVIL